MSNGSIGDDVGQVAWIGFAGPELTDDLQRRIAGGECGAVILFKRNLHTAVAGDGGVGAGAVLPQEVTDLAALIELNRALHAAAPAGAPLWIAVDQEGGTVARVRAPATQWPPMMSHDGFGAGDDAVLAEEVGLALGTELAALGFDLDFAPVLDVHTNERNPIIGERAFGRDAAAVARRGLAFARGLARAGILGCGKHFPGHGDTSTDSHLELPRIDHDWARLEAVELRPFAEAARARMPMIMTAHVVFAALDPDVPATLSRKVVTGLLRERLGYDGLIVSDDLDMRAIADHFGVGDAAVAAVRAGCDAILLCRNEQHQREAAAALRRAAEADSMFRAQLGVAADRIRAVKRAHVAGAGARPALDVVGALAHRRLADRLAGRA